MTNQRPALGDPTAKPEACATAEDPVPRVRRTVRHDVAHDDDVGHDHDDDDDVGHAPGVDDHAPSGGNKEVRDHRPGRLAIDRADRAHLDFLLGYDAKAGATTPTPTATPTTAARIRHHALCHESTRTDARCDSCGQLAKPLHMPEQFHGFYCRTCCPACNPLAVRSVPTQPRAIPALPTPDEQHAGGPPARIPPKPAQRSKAPEPGAAAPRRVPEASQNSPQEAAR